MNLNTLKNYGIGNLGALLGPNMIGFDHIEKLINETYPAATYPPFNVKKVSENQYVVELAVAGFSKSDITITFEDGKLKVSGKSSANEEDSGSSYLHKGVAARDFMRMFSLSSDVEVTSADMTNGMLKIWLERLIPENAKPKTIPINDDEYSTERATVKQQKDKK